jgi:hypothetical protein
LPAAVRLSEAGVVSIVSERAELSSVRSQLEEVTRRIVVVGDRYRNTENSALTSELDQAERTLLGARRALDRALGTLAELEGRPRGS